MKISATEFKKNFGKYLDLAAQGEEIIITKNDKTYAKMGSAKKDPIESLKGLVGIIDEKDFPPEGEDPRFDGIIKRGKK